MAHDAIVQANEALTRTDKSVSHAVPRRKREGNDKPSHGSMETIVGQESRKCIRSDGGIDGGSGFHR